MDQHGLVLGGSSHDSSLTCGRQRVPVFSSGTNLLPVDLLKFLIWISHLTINSYSSTVLILSYFQSYILCIAHHCGEGNKCMGAHLPQDNCRRPLRREYPTRGILLLLPDQESNPVSLLQKSWPWVEVLVWVGLKALQGGGIGTGVLGNLR